MRDPGRRDPERWRRLLRKVAKQEPLPRHVERQRLGRTPLGHGPQRLARSLPGAGNRAPIAAEAEGGGGARQEGGSSAGARWRQEAEEGRSGGGGGAAGFPTARAHGPRSRGGAAGRWGASAKRRIFEPAHKRVLAQSRRPGGAAGWWRLAERAPECPRGRKCASQGEAGKPRRVS